MGIRPVTDDSFQADVLDSDKPVVVDFFAEWCGPCKAIAPALAEIADELADQVTIVKLDADESPESPTRFGVRGFPTMILFKNGEIAATKLGAATKREIKEWITERL